MKAVFLLCLLAAGCTHHARPVPPPLMARAPGHGNRIDLGDLDDPLVQRQVVARETYRNLANGFIHSFQTANQQSEAFAVLAGKLSNQMDQERLQHCANEIQAANIELMQLPPTMTFTLRKTNAFIERVERGGYAPDDGLMKTQADDMKLALDEVIRQTGTAELGLKRVCQCLGITVEIRNPVSGQVVFKTDVPDTSL